MQVHKFAIPQSLSQVIENGQWPGSISDYYRQEANPPIDEEVVQRIFPDFDKIVFMNPPFHTIGDKVENGNDFWVSFLTNFGEINYDKAVIVADFGSGYDYTGI